MAINGVAHLLVRAEEADVGLGNSGLGIGGGSGRTEVIDRIEIEREVRVSVLLFQVHSFNMLFPSNRLPLMRPPLFNRANSWFNLPQLLKDSL